MAEKPDPSATSSDYRDMYPEWKKIQDIRSGIGAIRLAKTDYLPRYPAESETDYNNRLATTPWRPEFEDALDSMCSKPFTKEVKFADESAIPQSLRVLAENIDGKGNNMHVFARNTFWDGVALGLAGIYVTYSAKKPA